VAGRPSAAQDSNVIVVTAATAARNGLRSIAGLPGGRHGWCSAVRPNALSAFTACGLKQTYRLLLSAY
jgi:hypothetical protein